MTSSFDLLDGITWTTTVSVMVMVLIFAFIDTRAKP